MSNLPPCPFCDAPIDAFAGGATVGGANVVCRSCGRTVPLAELAD